MSDASGAVAAKARDTIERQVLHMVRLADDLVEALAMTQGKISSGARPWISVLLPAPRSTRWARPWMPAQMKSRLGRLSTRCRSWRFGPIDAGVRQPAEQLVQGNTPMAAASP